MELKNKSVILLVMLFGCQISTIYAHGMLMDPVSRGSRWRIDPSAPHNYNDNELFCGGYTVQWSNNGGKCGLCGDNYADAKPRHHENGGTYGNGVIVNTYKAGQTMPVAVLITANHKGHFLFDLCNLDTSAESDECFAAYKLKLANGQDKYPVPNGKSGVFFNTSVVLPPNLNCKQCVLRWTYVAGNTWGMCDNGSGAVGCGPQEHFRGCSDIRIEGNGRSNYEIASEPKTVEYSPRNVAAKNIDPSLFKNKAIGRNKVIGQNKLPAWILKMKKDSAENQIY